MAAFIDAFTLKFPIMDLGGRWTFRDLASFVGDPEPRGVDATAFEQLQAAANDLGVGLLDLRGEPRKMHHPMRERVVRDGHDFGTWGWFRDEDPKHNLPIRGRAHGTIPWKKRTALLWHTTAVSMWAARFLGVPTNGGIADNGDIVVMHPGNAYLWGAHAANRFAIGLEISGKSSIQPHQIEPAKALTRFFYAERQEHHEGQMVGMTHAMSKGNRNPQDCGRAIWEAVGWPMIQELGLKVGPTVGSGGNPKYVLESIEALEAMREAA